MVEVIEASGRIVYVNPLHVKMVKEDALTTSVVVLTEKGQIASRESVEVVAAKVAAALAKAARID